MVTIRESLSLSGFLYQQLVILVTRVPATNITWILTTSWCEVISKVCTEDPIPHFVLIESYVACHNREMGALDTKRRAST